MNKIAIFFFPFLSNEISRTEWVKRQLIKIPKGQSILDVGAGELRFKNACSHLKYVSQDLGEYKGKGDKAGLQTGKWNTSKVNVTSDIVDIPVNNSSFDNVLCTEVLEHIPHPELAIKEISRILKKGGRLILTAPFCSMTHFSPYFFLTGFSTNWYKKVLPNYDLKILKMEANGNYFDYISQELARFPLMAKKYSPLGLISLLLYPIIVPPILLFWLISKFSKDSEKQLCYGWHVLAKKV